MNSMVVVDTDVLVDAIHGIGIAVNRLAQERLSATLVISSMTRKELLVGCLNKTEQKALLKFLTSFQLIKLNASIDDRADELLQKYNLSHGLWTADAFIAATALTLDCSLLSKNQRDFRFIQDLKLLPYP
jgi:predicted nucleic acid-binding protein